MGLFGCGAAAIKPKEEVAMATTISGNDLNALLSSSLNQAYLGYMTDQQQSAVGQFVTATTISTAQPQLVMGTAPQTPAKVTEPELNSN